MRFSGEYSVQDQSFPIEKTDEEWRHELSPDAYRVLRKHGTEPAGTSPLNHEKREGQFVCAGCGHALFDSKAKYESGSGWPSFYRPKEGAVGSSTDNSFLMTRTEVHCAQCGGHLGHVFSDGPAPTGQRYCMNGAALNFRSKES
ncbi:MAG TPA: peptide-methionine (R)-S-oxide reductase MsrB [Rhizomicrobium sp.]|nr:peptide-methionine (R)-S-oxide reductase MsrB [Rhizomicrobium sp.]